MRGREGQEGRRGRKGRRQEGQEGQEGAPAACWGGVPGSPAPLKESWARMMDVSQAFLQQSVSLLASDFLPKVERCLEHLTDEDVWWRPNDASNSIGNLMLHLSGNVTQWILGGVGGQARERHRQQEFDERTHIPAKDLLAKLEIRRRRSRRGHPRPR